MMKADTVTDRHTMKPSSPNQSSTLTAPPTAAFSGGKVTTTTPSDASGPVEATAAQQTARADSGTSGRWLDLSRDPQSECQPKHYRWLLGALLLGSAALYLWGLDRNGWANAYYSAAAQAGGSSWKAWFFGSFDAANAITVDKPPASLWVMGLSVRLFGGSYWSALVPQALMGVATVGIVNCTVRRWFGARAGLIAGTVTATTPVAVLMFRFNNPDALLVLLLVAAAWAMTRATEKGSLPWIALAGALVGFAFLTKMMQAFLVLPGFVAMYAVAAPVDFKRRLGHLLVALAAMFAAASWWVAIVQLWPASARPYIGGSQANSMLELIFGYNGLGRITGNEAGSVVPGGGPANRAESLWGETGWTRLFNHSYGGQIAWLLPAAIAMIAVLLWFSRGQNRLSRVRAAALGWGGWLLVTAAVISFSQGIIHEYYTVALVPAIGALTGTGAILLWQRRDGWAARITMSALVAATAVWSYALMARSAGFVPPLRWLILIVGLVLAMAILLANRMRAVVAAAIGIGAMLVLLAGPLSYAVETATTVASGSLPSAGPAVAGGPGGMHQPPFGPPGAPGGPDPATGQSLRQGTGWPPHVPVTAGPSQAQMPPPGFATAGATSLGGLLEASQPSSELIAALLTDADEYTWVAATTGSQSAAGYQLATQQPILSIGGFNGSDPAPTLAQFQQWVATGRIHYYIPGGAPGGGPGGGPGGAPNGGGLPGVADTNEGATPQLGGSRTASQIASWVSANFSPGTIANKTVYDLSQPSRAGIDTGDELGTT